MILNINTDAAVIFTNKLEKMSKSSLPIAVRGALNKAAFNTKQNTLLKESQKDFINRQPNFFKANSKVDMAKGFDIRKMKSTIGMVSSGLHNPSNNYAVQDLEEQEHGGEIDKKSFIPLDKARGGNKNKLVKNGNRLSSIQKIVNAKNGNGKNRHEKFIRSAIHAGVGGYVIGNFQKAILWKVTSIKRKKLKIRGRSSTIKLGLQPLYTFQKQRSVKVGAKHFMKNASLLSAKKLEDYFVAEAKRQLQKL